MSLDPGKRKDIRITNGQLSIKIKNSRRHRDRQKGRYECVAGAGETALMSLPAQLDIAHIDKFAPVTEPGPGVVGNVGVCRKSVNANILLSAH